MQRALLQENTYDCRVFTIVSIYLLLHGLELGYRTYNQRKIYMRKMQVVITHTRHHLAEEPVVAR